MHQGTFKTQYELRGKGGTRPYFKKKSKVFGQANNKYAYSCEAK